MKIRREHKLAIALLVLISGVSGQVVAQNADESITGIQTHWEFGAQLVHEQDSFWGLAETFAPTAGYDDSQFWSEIYLKGGFRSEMELENGLTVYGGGGLLATATVSEDVFQQGDTGRILLDEAYIGIRSASKRWDASIGRQPFKVGQELLIGIGAGNGFERGAASMAPRKSWAIAAKAGYSNGPWAADAFYLDADELESGDTATTLAGITGRWQPDATSQIGAAWFKVLGSYAPYPQAPITIIDGGREGLESFDVFWSYEPTSGSLSGFSFKGEAAVQRNDRINLEAYGFGVDIGYRFQNTRWTPKLSYSPRYFSGDDPSTSGKLERFDPLFYNGAPPTWASGGNGSFAFYNSNLWVQRYRLELVISQTNFINLNYYDVKAAETFSPIQYGQSARPVVVDGEFTIISGVSDRALTRELYFEHTHVFNQNTFFTWGIAAAFPQKGIDGIVSGGGQDWYGLLANIVISY